MLKNVHIRYTREMASRGTIGAVVDVAMWPYQRRKLLILMMMMKEVGMRTLVIGGLRFEYVRVIGYEFFYIEQ